MKKKYKICSRMEVNGKVIWPNTGMSLTVREDGKMTLFDPRTKENYFLFELEQRPQQQGYQQQPPPQQAAQQRPQGQPADEFDDDIPF